MSDIVQYDVREKTIGDKLNAYGIYI